MANVTIPDLVAASALDGAELMLVNQDGFTRKLDLDALVAFAGGEIVQRGSNADGSWVRFADGTQICWYSNNAERAVTFSARTEGTMNGFIHLETWTFPVAFVNANVVTGGGAQLSAGTNNATISGVHPNSDPNPTSVVWMYWAALNVDSINSTQYWAIGRWY